MGVGDPLAVSDGGLLHFGTNLIDPFDNRVKLNHRAIKVDPPARIDTGCVHRL